MNLSSKTGKGDGRKQRKKTEANIADLYIESVVNALTLFVSNDWPFLIVRVLTWSMTPL